MADRAAGEKEYRLLIVEDSPEDAALNEREIRKVLSPCRFLTVDDGDAVSRAIDEFAPDVVVSDFFLPSFDGLAVLRLVLEKAPFTPVIIVTGSIDEETAVSCIKSGAADYILKENVRRLGHAVLTALKQKEARVRHDETRAALVESEERYRALFENDPAGNFVTGADGRIISCNRAFAAALGFRSAAEAEGRIFIDLCRDPRRGESFLRILGDRKNVEDFDMELSRRDGSVVYARVSAYGVFARDGGLERIVGFIIDETERKRLEEKLAQSQKLESLGTLAGGIAHDFNNILNIILGYLSFLEKAAVGAPAAGDYARTIREAAERGADLVRQLLTFARKGEPRSEPVRLPDVAGETARLARATFPRTIEIDFRADPEAPVVIADRSQIHQAFLNLCINARDAMPDGGTITFRSGVADRHTLAAKFPEVEDERYAFVRVEDTGTGMDEQVRKRIFEPFFTTKARGAGTGLGLALVYGIVKKHDGFVDVESEPGKGSAFTVYLPVRDAPGAAVRARRPDGGTAARKNAAILVAEDESTLRDFAAAVLTSAGYRVLTAADGESALDLFLERRSGIDLVLADFGLPKMDGGELARRVRAADGRVSVLLMSGFLDPDLKPLIEKSGVTTVLHKPFSPGELLVAVDAALGGGPGGAGTDDA